MREGERGGGGEAERQTERDGQRERKLLRDNRRAMREGERGGGRGQTGRKRQTEREKTTKGSQKSNERERGGRGQTDRKRWTEREKTTKGS